MDIRPRFVADVSECHILFSGKAWTCFSDIFAVAMVVIVLTGLFMLRGKHSLIGIGGIEFLIGVLIPLLFVLL